MGQVADRPVGAILGSKSTFVEQHPNRLDGVQRHAVRAFEDESHGGIRQARNEAVEALGHHFVTERLEREGDRVAASGSPVRPPIEQVRARERHDEDRMGTAPLEHVVDEVEKARIGPLEVLEEEDRQALVGDALEERPPRREQLLALAGAALLDAEQLEKTRLDPASLLRVGDVLGDGGGDPLARRRRVVGLGQPGPLPDHLAERPERDALAVGGRASLVPVDVLDDAVDVLVELPAQAGLADPGHPDERHQPGSALARGRVQQLLEDPHLGVASNERRLERLAAVRAAPHRDDAIRAPRADRQLLPLEHLLAGGLEGDRHRCGAHRPLVDEEAAGRRRGLESRSGVDHVAGDHALARRADRHGGLAGRDARPQLEVRRIDLGAQLTDREDQLESGANGALGIILVGGRRAERGHDGVTDELLDDAAVSLDDLARHLEVAGQQLADVLGIAGLGQAREAHEVGEEDRDQPPLRHAEGRVLRGRIGRRGRGRWLGEGGSTFAAEEVAGGGRRAARGAAQRQAGATVRAELSAGLIGRSTGRTGHRCSGTGRGLWRQCTRSRESDTLLSCRSSPKSRRLLATSSASSPVRRSARRPSAGIARSGIRSRPSDSSPKSPAPRSVASTGERRRSSSISMTDA